MRTSSDDAYAFCTQLFADLSAALCNPRVVQTRTDEIFSHSPKFAETRFCKGCVLPIVDTVATRFLQTKSSLTTNSIRRSLLCEGYSSLPKIYRPGNGQSGFGGSTWGTNFQPYDKQGRRYTGNGLGSLPSPDFGIAELGYPMLNIVGETKYAPTSCDISLEDVRRDLRYYLGLPVEPHNRWNYDFGFGIAYAGGGDTQRTAVLHTDDWATSKFMIAQFIAKS